MNLEQRWYQTDVKPAGWLRCLAWLYGKISTRMAQKKQLRAYQPALPTIVVGNLSVGGTGKSPVVQALVKSLQTMGYKPCVLTRGYKSEAAIRKKPHWVKSTDSAQYVGDEPLMLHLTTGVDVLVSPDRVSAAKEAEKLEKFDLLILDDGLQHWPIKGHYSICVVDGARGFGNGYLLPAGPLRESLDRLQKIDHVLINGPENAIQSLPQRLGSSLSKSHFLLEPVCFRETATGLQHSVQYFHGKHVQVMVGIGNPDRFTGTLHQLGIQTDQVFTFPDHHTYCQDDLLKLDPNLPVVTTSKDWVKLKAFSTPMFVLEVEATLSLELISSLEVLLHG